MTPRRNDDPDADVFLIGLTLFVLWSILQFIGLVAMSWYGSTLPPEDQAKHERTMQLLFPPPEDN